MSPVAPVAGSGRPAGAGRWLSELAGLVVAGGLPDDDVHAVVGVDEGDDRHQRDELVIVVVLGRVRPGLVGDTTTGGVGDAGALLGEFQRGPLAPSRARGPPPRRGGEWGCPPRGFPARPAGPGESPPPPAIPRPGSAAA